MEFDIFNNAYSIRDLSFSLSNHLWLYRKKITNYCRYTGSLKQKKRDLR